MDLGLRGKTALVAAASKGLGKGVARALAAEGAHVVMFSRDKAAIEAAASDVAAVASNGARVVAMVANVTSTADLDRVVTATTEQFGALDILFNNAGGPRPGMFDSLSDDDWQSAFELNLMSAVRLTRLCLPHMKRQRWGRVITSTSSSVKAPIANLMLSNAVRSATTAWAKSLSDQVARDGITVNCLAPGRIDTERIRQLDADTAERQGRSVDEVTRASLASIPTGRLGDPAEFGAAAAFLASQQASYINGVTLLVDGGQFRGTY